MNQQLFNSALKHLSARNSTVFELRLALEKEFSSLDNVDIQITDIIQRLEELHLINDGDFANRQAERLQHKGNRFIEQTLKQKGLDKEAIDKAITALSPEPERALAEAQKKWESYKNIDNSARDNKLLRFLSGRGFSMEACYHCINILKLECSDTE